MRAHINDAPLVTSRRGFFWVGSETTQTAFGTVARGPMFVHWEAPQPPRAAPPIVLVHGGGGQGTDWLGTPDGRPGWAPLLVEQGYIVYVVDRPGHGRSPLTPEILGPIAPPLPYEVADWLFAPGPDSPPTHPTAHLHSQWPGPGGGDDPALHQLMASSGPMIADTAAAQALEQARGVELLEQIGPAVVITHSAGGPLGWLLADARPDLVAGIVAVEPLGPPFLEGGAGGFSLPWGLTAAPVTYDPPAASAAELELVTLEGGPPEAPPARLQADPPRRLVNVARVPIALLSGEASPFVHFDGLTAGFLRQSGCQVDLIRLADRGVHGNGHGLIFERNHREVLAVALEWIDALPAG